MKPAAVFVFGELNPDIILSTGNVRPEPNREQWIDRYDIVLGSSSAITAVRLADLGHPVFFVSVVGDDDFGRFCRAELERRCVDTRYIVSDPAEKTGVTFALSGSGDRSLLTYPGTIPRLTPEHIPPEWLQEAGHIHFGSYFLQKGMKPYWLSLFQLARARKISTSFDSGWDPEEGWDRREISELLAYTDLFIPSEDELNRIVGAEHWTQVTDLLPKRYGSIVVKRGRGGAAMISREEGVIVSPAFRIDPVDTTGAGDSFNAGLISSFLAGRSASDMLAFANACGALSALEVGGTGSRIDEDRVLSFMK